MTALSGLLQLLGGKGVAAHSGSKPSATDAGAFAGLLATATETATASDAGTGGAAAPDATAGPDRGASGAAAAVVPTAANASAAASLLLLAASPALAAARMRATGAASAASAGTDPAASASSTATAPAAGDPAAQAAALRLVPPSPLAGPTAAGSETAADAAAPTPSAPARALPSSGRAASTDPQPMLDVMQARDPAPGPGVADDHPAGTRSSADGTSSDAASVAATEAGPRDLAQAGAWTLAQLQVPAPAPWALAHREPSSDRTTPSRGDASDRGAVLPASTVVATATTVVVTPVPALDATTGAQAEPSATSGSVVVGRGAAVVQTRTDPASSVPLDPASGTAEASATVLAPAAAARGAAPVESAPAIAAAAAAGRGPVRPTAKGLSVVLPPSIGPSATVAASTVDEREGQAAPAVASSTAGLSTAAPRPPASGPGSSASSQGTFGSAPATAPVHASASVPAAAPTDTPMIDSAAAQAAASNVRSTRHADGPAEASSGPSGTNAASSHSGTTAVVTPTGVAPAVVPAPRSSDAAADPSAVVGAAAPTSARMPSVSAPVPSEAHARPTSTVASVDSTQAAAVVATPASAPAPAAAPSTAAPASTAGASSLPAQLAEPMLSLRTRGDGDHVVIVKVTPEHLGPVTVHAHVSRGDMDVQLFAPTADARDALKSMLSDLRRDLGGGAAGSTTTLGLGTGDAPQDQGRQSAGSGGGAAASDGGRRDATPWSSNRADARGSAQADRPVPDTRPRSSSTALLDVLA